MSSSGSSSVKAGAGLAAKSGDPDAGSRKELAGIANEGPDEWTVPVRGVMQMGTFITVPIAATVALLAGRRELAATLALGGTAAWVLAKQAKPLDVPTRINPSISAYTGALARTPPSQIANHDNLGLSIVLGTRPPVTARIDDSSCHTQGRPVRWTPSAFRSVFRHR